MASPRPASPVHSNPHIPTTNLTTEEYPRFRILVFGRSGVGKSSLINAIFKASLAEVEHDRAGAANINKGITSPHNKHLILHDSQGYEPGDKEKFNILESFITEQTQKQSPSERLHAIWLCIPCSYAFSGGRVFETGEEKIFKLNRNKVPIIVVMTKFDLYIAWLSRRGKLKGPNISQEAVQLFKQMYGHRFEMVGVSQDRPIPYTLVSISMPETLLRLVKITMNNMGLEAPTSSPTFSGRIKNFFFSRSTDNDWLTRVDGDSSAQFALALAQRVDITTWIAASIKFGEKRYWSTIVSGILYLSVNIREYLFAIHKDIVMFWNMDEFFLSDVFCDKMMVIVDNLIQKNPSVIKGVMMTVAARLSVYQRRIEYTRCLMGYVVDLTLILQAVSQLCSPSRVWFTEKAQDRVNEIVYVFYCSEKRNRIHKEIMDFVSFQRPFGKRRVLDKIASLIRENQITEDDAQLDKRSPLLTLLQVLKFELSVKGLTVNKTILDLVRKLLDLREYDTIISELETSDDIELVLDYMLYIPYLLCNNTLSDSGIKNASREARILMFRLISEINIMPRCLSMTDTKIDLSVLDVGDFERVVEGEHNGQQVVLTALHKVRHEDDLLRKDFRRQALTWRSVVHSFIHPLLGIFEHHSQLFLVSPLMRNGTLTQWRKDETRSVAEIQTRILEVAKGVQYIHSNGIVHGNLHGDNVLLDSNFRCQITDFSLTRYFDAANVSSTMPFSVNFAAPELFDRCNKCDRPKCDMACNIQRKTTQTDVYAFGCLYHAIFFDTIPFKGDNESQIIQLITTGAHPDRLDTPAMKDNIWDLIRLCWMNDPSKRPILGQVIMNHMEFTPLPSLLATLSESAPFGGPTVNKDALHLMCTLLDTFEVEAIVSELSITSDVELLLDFLLRLLRDGNLTNLSVPGANRKARRLMFKLISVTNIVPRSLFITDVKIETHITIGTGGFGRVFRGEHKGKPVALKLVEKGRKDNSLINDFCQEALAWRSLSHRFILPLLGIYEKKLQLFLVSPFMPNGTLNRWRKKHSPAIAEVHRLMLEVAEGMQHLHSEGVVHGDLHGENVLLDSELHCKITDFGLTRHSETTVAASTRAFSPNFAAPELFGLCTTCGQSDCDGCDEDRGVQHRSKTMKTDVYAFGCLYYAIFFGVAPFHEKNDFQIVRLVMVGERPCRLESPKIADDTWNLIARCWISKPSERPTMAEIVETMKSLPQ